MTLRSVRALFVAGALANTIEAQTPDTVPAGTVASDPTRDAYLDDTARRLVLGVKAARDTARRNLDSYTAVIRERLGAEFPSFRRDRPWFHGERAARVRWSRDEPGVVHVLGARFRDPSMGPDHRQFFPGLRTERFATDPFVDPFTFGYSVVAPATLPNTTTLSPLEHGSERHYQFRSGDTISVQLLDGGTRQAVAVTVTPRYASIRLVSAIMWIDPESFGLARVAYRLAKPVDREISWQLRTGGRWRPGFHVDIGPGDPADTAVATDSTPTRPGVFDRLVNGAFNNVFPRFEMDISTVVADYGFWEMRHWLLRAVTWRGHIIAEEVTASGVAPPAVPVTIDWTLEIEGIRESGAEAIPGTPATAAEALGLWQQEGDSISGELAAAGPDETVTITPANRDALTTSDVLPPSLWEGIQAVDDGTLERIAAELASIGTGEGGDRTAAPSPWLLDPPGKTLRLLRYNPVEHVSVGTRLRRDFGWGRAALTARVGTAGLELPDIDLTVQRNHPGHRMLVSFYRTLRDGHPGERGAGRPGIYVTGDPADFHWSHGAAIRFLPPAGERNWLSLRLFAEQDADIVTDTRRNRVGGAAAWRPWWGGFESGSFGGGGRASVRASAGDNPHVRAVVEGALLIPLPSRLSLGIQAGTARVWGDPAPPDLWRIGGSGRWLRGHAESVRGSRVHMTRVDLQRPITFLRLSAFGDWARASGRDFQAVGLGLVFMDGMMRLDVARGLRWDREGGPDAVLRLHFLGDTFF
ncbi:MAG: hypothetical protein F4Y07_12065 [Gemmatimonadetes bacterium]|nr:hypothetical protein [Gemmatimonadota bacterium]MYE17205.1 hypothetical protein [Gemmatimonadota bacterium]